jgi:hypothetical protein
LTCEAVGASLSVCVALGSEDGYARSHYSILWSEFDVNIGAEVKDNSSKLIVEEVSGWIDLSY